MNTFFFLFEDELLYSALARFRRYTGLSKNWIQENFFGNKKVQPKIHLPNCLDFFCESLGHAFTPEYILNHHSAFNYYAAFSMPSSRDAAKKQARAYEYRHSAGNLLGIDSNNINRSRLKYCTECVREDLEGVGVPYFHVSHNLNGIGICHRHGCMLKEYEYSIGYDALDVKKTNNQQVELLPWSDIHWNFAKIAYEILYSEASTNRIEITNKIKSLLYEKGFVNSNGYINQKKWGAWIEEFYGSDFLESIHINMSGESAFYRAVTRMGRCNIDPIAYLAAINILSGSYHEFQQTKVTYTGHKSPAHIVQGLQEPEQLAKLEASKSILLDIYTANPDLLRSQIRYKRGKDFELVQRRDPVWIEENLPAPRKGGKYLRGDKKNESAVGKDEALMKELQNAYSKLIKEIPEVRITKFLLEKCIEKPNLVKSHKFPLSNQYISSITESPSDFKWRRCKRIIDEMIDEGIDPTIYRIKTRSLFKENYKFDPVRDQVEQYLRMKGISIKE